MGSFSIWHWLVVLLSLPLVALYHLPTTIAIFRKSDRALVVQLINIFLGWTVIGWGVALFFALKKVNMITDQRSM